MIDEDKYNESVNNQWKKLSKAQSLEELKEVLSTWPEPKDYEIKEQNENSIDSSSEERE